MAIWNILLDFTGIWYIILPFGTFYVHLVHFSGFGTMYQEKSGNTVTTHKWALSMTSLSGY
jgi:hypothetical protein